MGQHWYAIGLDIWKISSKIKVREIEGPVRRNKLANIKSQIKRNKQSQAARLRNRVYRGTARTMVRKAQVAIKTAEKVVGAYDETIAAIKALDKAAAKGVIHKNNAARRKARLMAKLNAIEAK